MNIFGFTYEDATIGLVSATALSITLGATYSLVRFVITNWIERRARNA